MEILKKETRKFSYGVLVTDPDLEAKVTWNSDETQISDFGEYEDAYPEQNWEVRIPAFNKVILVHCGAEEEDAMLVAFLRSAWLTDYSCSRLTRKVYVILKLKSRIQSRTGILP